jgi:hypothetical protein
MKKIYLMGLAAVVALSVNAQTTIRVKNPLVKRQKSEAGVAKGTLPVVNPNQVASNIVCNTQYVAGTTMTLNMTYTATNTDLEFVDYLEITFPAGITPNSSTNATFPTSNSAGGAEALNGASGQVISWGVDNNDQYGGIITTATGVAFDVNVTIGAAVTGNQMATYLASGDGYGAAPGDQVGATFTIYPTGASIDDAYAKLGGVQGATSYCNNGMLDIGVRVVNSGTNAISNLPVSYTINGGAAVVESIAGPIAPGDSADYLFTAQGDFSAAMPYAIKIYTGLAGDVNAANDTLNTTFANTVSVPLTSMAYSNGFETQAELNGILAEPITGTGANWGLTTLFHTGVYSIGLVANTPAYGDAWIFLPCMDATMGETYHLTFWKRTTSGYNGSIEIMAGANPMSSSMLLPVKSLTANTADGIWYKDSVDMMAPASATIYLGFHGVGTANTSIRIDDINISKVVPVGIKTNASSSIGVYPNPSTGIVNLSLLNANSSVEVFSVIGERVYSKANLNKGINTLDLSSLAEGTYVVRILSGSEVATKKITIAK